MSNASHYVVEALGITDFITANWPSLYLRLEQAAKQAERSAEPKTAFMTSSLPIISGLIHFASTRDRLHDAATWARGHQPDSKLADATSTLAALALLYIVDNGANSNVGSPEVWSEMRQLLSE